ncbi:MAG: hypothetical protein JST54_30760 [Deltaproteobacteria bacterium]|nr:hypothetical protein [Deltaproteobacteria bacterium]
MASSYGRFGALIVGAMSVVLPAPVVASTQFSDGGPPPSAIAVESMTDAGSVVLVPSLSTPTSRITYPDGGAAPFMVFGVGTAADYDGDGLIDYSDESWDTGKFWVHLNANTSPPTWSSANWGGRPSQNGTASSNTTGGWEQLVGSFSSANGRADFIDHWLPSGEFWVHQNYGDGGFAPSGTNWGHGYTHATQSPNGDPGWEFMAGDFDGDGFADIVEHYRPTGQFWVYKNYHDGGFGSPISGTGVIASGTSAAGPRWLMAVGDFDHDGYADYADVRPFMYGDTPDAGVFIHTNLHNGAFNTMATVGPADYGSEVELLTGSWEHPHTCTAFGPGTVCGVMQYAFHDVPTGQLTGVELDFNNGSGYHWNEVSSTTSTESAPNWQILAVPHRVWNDLTNGLPNGIGYDGSYVMAGTIKVYVLEYGHVSAADFDVIDLYLNALRGSNYGAILNEYNDLRGDVVGSDVEYGGVAIYSGTVSSTITDLEPVLPNALLQTLDAGALPVDPNGVYVVITGDNVYYGWECGAVVLGNYQCGWHDDVSFYPTGIPYPIQLHWLWVGDTESCPNPSTGLCQMYQSQGPNGYPDGGGAAGDGMVNWIDHELIEMITDPGAPPRQSSWTDSAWTIHYMTDGGIPENAPNGAPPGHENADSCQFDWDPAPGTGGGTPNVNQWNVSLNLEHFFLQRMWTNYDGGTCSMAP